MVAVFCDDFFDPLLKEAFCFVENYFKEYKNDPSHDMLHIRRVVNLSMSNLKETLTEGLCHSHLIDPDEKSLVFLRFIVLFCSILHDIGDFKSNHKHTAEEAILMFLSSSKHQNIVTALVEIAKQFTLKSESLSCAYGLAELSKALACNVIEKISFRHELSEICQLPSQQQMMIFGQSKEIPSDLCCSVGKPSSMWELAAWIVQDSDRLDAIGAIGIARTFSFGAIRGTPFYNEHSLGLCQAFLPSIEKYNANVAVGVNKNNSSTLEHFYEKLLLIKDLIKTKYGRKLAIRRHQFMESFIQELKAEILNE